MMVLFLFDLVIFRRSKGSGRHCMRAISRKANFGFIGGYFCLRTFTNPLHIILRDMAEDNLTLHK